MCASQYFMDLSCENINYTPSGIKLIWSAIFYFLHKANLSFKLSGHYSTQSQMAQIWPRKFLNWATCLVRKVNLYCFGYINLNLFDFQFISIYPFWKVGGLSCSKRRLSYSYELIFCAHQTVLRSNIPNCSIHKNWK